MSREDGSGVEGHAPDTNARDSVGHSGGPRGGGFASLNPLSRLPLLAEGNRDPKPATGIAGIKPGLPSSVLVKPSKRGRKPRKRIARRVRIARVSAKRGQVSKPAKRRKISLSGLKAKMWERFRQYIRERDGNVCFTCDKGGLEGVNWHAGHFITRRKGSVIYDPANVHSQCSYCNRHLKGNAAEYAYRFIVKYGQAKFDALLLKSREIKPWKPNELRDLIAALERGGADYELLYEQKYGLSKGA